MSDTIQKSCTSCGEPGDVFNDPNNYCMPTTGLVQAIAPCQSTITGQTSGTILSCGNEFGTPDGDLVVEFGDNDSVNNDGFYARFKISGTGAGSKAIINGPGFVVGETIVFSNFLDVNVNSLSFKVEKIEGDFVFFGCLNIIQTPTPPPASTPTPPPNLWYNVIDPDKPSVCLCINDGNEQLHGIDTGSGIILPTLYQTETQCMNSECPLPPFVCDMTISSVQQVGCVNNACKFLIQTIEPEYDAMIQIKIGDNGEWQDVEKYNGTSKEVTIQVSDNSNPIFFRLYKYVCEDQRCFINWPNLEWNITPPSSPKVKLKSVNYDDGDNLQITGLSYKYVPPYYIPGPGGIPQKPRGDYGEVWGGVLSSGSRTPALGDLVNIYPENGSPVVQAVYRIIEMRNCPGNPSAQNEGDSDVGDSDVESNVCILVLECANYLCDDIKNNMVGYTVETIYVHQGTKVDCLLTDPSEGAGPPLTLKVKVGSVTNKGQKILFNDKYENPLFLTRGTNYKLDLSDPSMAIDELGFSLIPDGRDSSGNISSEIQVGQNPALVLTGSQGTAGCSLDIDTKALSSGTSPSIPFKPDNETQEFYYFSKNNPGKGGKITMATKSLNDGGEDGGSGNVEAPCVGGHTCDRAKFYIKINGVKVLESNLNNLSDTTSKPSSKFGGNWAPLPSGIGNNQYDRRCAGKITKEMNDQIFAAADSDPDDSAGAPCQCGDPENPFPSEAFTISIEPMEDNKNPHIGVTWARIKNRCGQVVFSCCIGQSFCPDCPPPNCNDPDGPPCPDPC